MAIDAVALTVFYSVLIVLGIPGNLLILACYIRKAKKVGTDVFITGLACCDLYSSGFHAVKIKIDVPSDAYCQFNYFGAEISIYTTLAVTLAISVDRYLAICWPTNRRPTQRAAGLVMCVCVLQGAAMRVPIFWNSRYNPQVGTCLPDKPIWRWVAFYDKYIFPTWYFSCVALSSLFYIRVLYALRKQSRVRNALTGRIVIKASDDTTKAGHPTSSTDLASTSQVHAEGASRESVVVQESSLSDRNHLSPLGPSVNTGANHSQPAAPQEPGPSGTVSQSAESSPTQVIVTSPSAPAPPGSAKPGEGKEAAASQKNDSQKTERRLTLMLGVTTIFYFLSWIPALVIRAIPPAYLVAVFSRSTTHHTVSALFFRLYEVNSALNIFLYWGLNRRFRKDCSAILIQMKRALLKRCGKE